MQEKKKILMGEKGYVPHIAITNKKMNLNPDISEILTKHTVNDVMNQNPKLRRDNCDRTSQEIA